MAPRARPHVMGMADTRRHLRLVRSEPAPAQGYMAPIWGPRDSECGRYAECLGAHLRAHRLVDRAGRAETPCRCPSGCRFRVKRGERATDFMATNGHDWNGL